MACYLNADNGEHQWRDLLFSTRHACPECGISYAELEPRTFSFNSPYGVCPKCEGMGTQVQFDPELIIPDPDRSLADHAVAPWRRPAGGTAGGLTRRTLLRSGRPGNWTRTRPGLAWDRPAGTPCSTGMGRTGRSSACSICSIRSSRPPSARRKGQLAAYRGSIPCDACGGSRLRPEANSVLLGGRSIGQITALTVAETRQFLEGLEFAPSTRAISDPLLSEIVAPPGFS